MVIQGIHAVNWFINEQQADVVKMVYTLYLKGYSIFGIIAVLQQKGIPDPQGKREWSEGY